MEKFFSNLNYFIKYLFAIFNRKFIGRFYLLRVLLLLICIRYNTFSIFSQEIIEKSRKEQRMIFPERTSDINLPFNPKLVIFSGYQINPELESFTVGVEALMNKKASLNFTFGFANPSASQNETILSTNGYNFELATGVKLYFNNLNKRSNWFFNLSAYFSRLNYDGYHEVHKNWYYKPPSVVLFVFVIPGYWTAGDIHPNYYSVNVLSFGIETILGFQKVILNRLPLEISAGIILRKNYTKISGYEESDTQPESDEQTGLEFPGGIGVISFKLGYLIYK